MILFRSYRNKILLASLAFALFGAIQASFILPASTISKNYTDVNVNLVNGVAIRILNSAATTEITELDLSATAAPTGTFVADDFKVEVSTANKTGYKLYMSSSYQDTSTSTYTTDLVNQTNTSYTISTVPVATTKTDLRTATPGSTNANKWAYSLDDTTYNPVPVNSAPTQIDSYDDPTAGNQTPVYIGMNVNVEKPSGVYKNQLTFSAVGNPVPTAYSLYFEPGTTDPVAGLPDPNPMTASAVATSYTFTIPSTVPTRAGYSFTGYLDESTSTTYQPGGTITVLGDIDYTGSATLVAQWTIVSSTLTVDPNGGTWSGSTSTQTFPGDYGSTKVIGTPSTNAAYTISYNDNSQSATYSPNPPAPTSVSRPFTGWTLTATGGGSPSGSFDTTTNTYTYNIASDTLTAGYNTTSNTFTLPTVTKAGHTCTWHENSASGTSHTSGETNVTITANTEFYAVCTINAHTVTVNKGTGIASTTGSGSYDYGTNVAIGATLSAGYHFADPKWTVNSGGVTISSDSFTMPDNDVSVTANGAINSCSVHYNSNAPSGETAGGSTANSSFNYGTATATTANGFTVTGYDWVGWAESADGTVVISTSGGNMTAEQASSWCGTHGTTKQLYAKWTKKYTYTLNLNTNDGTTDKTTLNYPTSGGTTDTSHQFTNLNNQAPTRSGYAFLGWTTTTTGTSYVSSYTLQGSSAGSTPTTDGFPVTGNLYAIWKEIGIDYVANAPSGTVSGSMPRQTTVYLTSSSYNIDNTHLSGSTWQLTLYSPNWTLSGYGFKGWNTKADGTGTMYGPNETITLTSAQKTELANGGMTLYAQWAASAGNMASWSGCSGLSQGSVTALTYGSDTYAIAKLADGKCWMIENMRTSTNAGTDKGTSWTTAHIDRQYNLVNITGTAGATPTTSGSAAYQWKSYGGYYSWHSAINTSTAGSTQYYNWNTSSSSYTTTGTAQGICPSGWRLPRSFAGDGTTNNTNSDFRHLNYQLNGSYSTTSTAAGSNKWREYPNNFVFAGYWVATSSTLRGAYGHYWSSTVNNSGRAYMLVFYSTTVAPASLNGKGYGFSVRCVLGS